MADEEGFQGFPMLLPPPGGNEAPSLVAAPQPASSGSRVPLTARSTVTDASSGLQGGPQPSPPVGAAGGKPRSNLEHRNKVPLEKGYSQVDWMRLSRAAPAPKLRKDITRAEVRRHYTKDDAWMVFRNRVYSIGPYLRFHPGGPDILMKVAGKDGTSLFMKYHAWVNIDALMEKCLVGYLAEEDGGGLSSVTGPGGPAGTAGADDGTAMAEAM